jgi:hypothetical protein
MFQDIISSGQDQVTTCPRLVTPNGIEYGSLGLLLTGNKLAHQSGNKILVADADHSTGLSQVFQDKHASIVADSINGWDLWSYRVVLD